jgi:hypothetical protein
MAKQEGGSSTATILGTIVAIIVAIGTAYIAGESRARSTAEDRIADYKNERDAEKEASANLREEVKTLEGDLRVLREACGPGREPRGAATPQTTPGNEGSSLAEVSLTSGRSASIPGTPLVLALTGLEFATGPNRHQAYFSLGLPGRQEKKVERADPGDSYAYEGYRIQVLRTDGAGASFSISRDS